MKENINKIINRACALWGVSKEDVLGTKRNIPLPFARSMIVKTIRDTFGFSYPKIGGIIGKNHSSAMYYYKMYDSEYKYNREFRNFAKAMEELVLDIKTDFQEELEKELKEIID